MRLANISATIALCVSLVLHGILMRGIVEKWLRDLDEAQRLMGMPLSKVDPRDAAANKLRIERPEELAQKYYLFGEKDGQGTGLKKSTETEEAFHGRPGEEDQPWLSRDPAGPGRMPDEPSMSTAIPGENGNAGSGQGGHPAPRPTIPSMADRSEAAPAKPFGADAAEATPKMPARMAAIVPPPPPPQLPPTPPSPPVPPVTPDRLVNGLHIPEVPLAQATVEPSITTPTTLPTQTPTPATRPVMVAMATPRPSAPTPPAPKTPPPQPPAAGAAESPGQPGRPGPAVAAADPAPQSDSEMDAFTSKPIVGRVVISAGKVDPRLGRKVKTIKPRLGLRGIADLSSMENPRVIVKVSFNETGKVTDVKVLSSSGSNEIDLPVMLALYQWWFEPTMDKDGKPHGDLAIFSMVFYN